MEILPSPFRRGDGFVPNHADMFQSSGNTTKKNLRVGGRSKDRATTLHFGALGARRIRLATWLGTSRWGSGLRLGSRCARSL